MIDCVCISVSVHRGMVSSTSFRMSYSVFLSWCNIDCVLVSCETVLFLFLCVYMSSVIVRCISGCPSALTFVC